MLSIKKSSGGPCAPCSPYFLLLLADAQRRCIHLSYALQTGRCAVLAPQPRTMASDEIIWDIINQQFVSVALVTEAPRRLQC